MKDAETGVGDRQNVCLVDEKGRFIGEEERDICHHGEGILHSAFLVMVFSEEGRLMQAQRSPAKTLWPDYWDGTVASHFYPGENRDASIRRRISEELGVSCGPLEHLFHFAYESRYRDVGVEKEVCHVFKTGDIRARQISPNPGEVSRFEFSSLTDLSQEVAGTAGKFTPWFLLAFRRYLQDIT